MKKASPYIKRIANFDQISNTLNNNYYTSVETDEHILTSLNSLSLIYAPISIEEDFLSTINNLSSVYVPISSFNNLHDDILTSYLTEEKIEEKYQTISGLNSILSSDYYTKTEIQEEVLSGYMNSVEVTQAIQTVNHLKKEVVSTLPQTQNALENTIYMVLNSSNLDSNIYDEYMLINNNFERIGNTAIDITNYANLNNENTFLDDQTISGDLTVTNNLNISSTVIAQSGYFKQDLQVAHRSINGYLTYVDTLFRIHNQGHTIEIISSTTITPKNEGIYKHTLSNNDVISFLTTYTLSSEMLTFELHLIQPSTPVSFTFGNQIKWIHDLNFNSLNPAPDFSEGDKEYAIVIRWDGEEFLGNLIYTKDIESE